MDISGGNTHLNLCFFHVVNMPKCDSRRRSRQWPAPHLFSPSLSQSREEWEPKLCQEIKRIDPL